MTGSVFVSFYVQNICIYIHIIPSEMCTLYHGNAVENPMYTHVRIVRAIEREVGTV